MIYRLVPMTSKFRNVLKTISEILYRLPAIVFFAWFSWFLVLLSDRSTPAVLYDAHLLTEHIKAGDNAVFKFSVDRTKVCRVQYNQTFYDSTGTRFIVPSYISLGNRGIVKGQILRLGITVPKGMAPGPARYESERQYACNWTQLVIPIYNPDPSIYFDVEP